MKRAAAVLAVVMVLFAGYIAAVSALLSVDKARTRAISQLSAWSGRVVTAGEEAELELFPSPSLILSDLHVSGPSGGRDNEIVVAERVRADIRLVPLLIGRISLGTLRLDNAEIRLLRDSEGLRNWQFDSAPAAVQLALTGDLPFDRFVLNNARITYDNRKRGESETAEVSSLELNWADIREPATLSATVIARGETVAFRARLRNAPAFFDGKVTSFSAELTSDMLNARFNGELADYKAFRFSGQLDASGPSLRRIISFAGGPRTTGPGLGPIAISGHTELKPERFFVDRGSLQLDDNSATGTLSVSIPVDGGKPKLTGTLAFSAMDITPYLHALGGADDVTWRERRIDTDWFDNFDADVRISAEQIVAGRYTFGSTAASAFMTNRLLEIGLAQA
ncbi:MAG TPA: AsmA family protein, partial [Afifellaceae bacterium]|nr:AsmA family protein [Afifellaceae bacterium]